MLITRTPYRISFMGGGSDFPAFYQDHGGAVLSTTIDKYCYIAARWMPPYLGCRYSVLWSTLDRCQRREEIRHPSVRGCLQYLGIDEPFEVNHAGDLPARSGMGSSSAFTVGLLHALHALRGRFVSRGELADQAIEVEQKVLQEAVGIQDQIGCAHGGLNLVEIGRDGGYSVRPVLVDYQRMDSFKSHLMLFFTGIVRNSSDVAAVQVANTRNKVDDLKRLTLMAHEGAAILTDGGPVERFGELLHEGWTLKRGMSAVVSNAVIDEAYEAARDVGAIGGKLLGAGGGGFLLIFARPSEQQKVRWALRHLTECEFRFERHGTQIVHSS